MHYKYKMTNQKTDHEYLHGISLAKILEYLIDTYWFEWLYEMIPINCFDNNPSEKSSLNFLRKTQWAREKVETLYIETKKEDWE